MKRVRIEINNKEYELRFNINSLIDLADEGINVLNFDSVDMSLKTIRTMFKHSIRHGENKKITDNRAGELMSEYMEEGHSFNELSEKIIEALALAMGSNKEEKQETDVKEDEGK
jgi:hypothetical protein